MAKERVSITDDPDGTKLLQRMEKAGIDVTVACPIDVMEDSRDEEAILAENKACANLAKRNPGKIIAFASIDPRRKNAPQLLKRCIEEYSMRGLKWHPDYSHFYPNSPEAYERLLNDAIHGDKTLFTRWDEVEHSWRFIDSISDAWSHEEPDFPNYAAKSDGPERALELLGRDGREWYSEE